MKYIVAASAPLPPQKKPPRPRPLLIKILVQLSVGINSSRHTNIDIWHRCISFDMLFADQYYFIWSF